jgi:hypothetical protein
MYRITVFAVLTLWPSIVLADWQVDTRKDMMTDEITKSVCSIDSNETRICIKFVAGTEMWIRFSKSPKLIEPLAIDLMVPILRVDDSKPNDVINVLRDSPREVHPDWATARYQVVDSPNGWGNPMALLYRLTHGKVLKIRLFLIGGYTADSSVSLDGIVDVLRQIAPPTVKF